MMTVWLSPPKPKSSTQTRISYFTISGRYRLVPQKLRPSNRRRGIERLERPQAKSVERERKRERVACSILVLFWLDLFTCHSRYHHGQAGRVIIFNLHIISIPKPTIENKESCCLYLRWIYSLSRHFDRAMSARVEGAYFSMTGIKYRSGRTTKSSIFHTPRKMNSKDAQLRNTTGA